jgi:hypothetical protein
VLVTVLLFAAPVAAALLSWGSWGWVAVALVIAVIEWVTWRRSEQFSARLWRSIGLGRRRTRQRGVESLYVISAAAGVVLLPLSLLLAR